LLLFSAEIPVGKSPYWSHLQLRERLHECVDAGSGACVGAGSGGGAGAHEKLRSRVPRQTSLKPPRQGKRPEEWSRT
jgi:hypothetical protein